MTALEIIEVLKKEGITLSARGASIAARSQKGTLTEAQKTLISHNKAAILEFLNPSPNGAVSAPDGAIYKEYRYPNGEVLQLTKDEFDNVVEIFRILIRQDNKLRQLEKAA